MNIKLPIMRICLIALLVCCSVTAQNKIDWQALDASGASISSQGARTLYSSFGQPPTGISTAGANVLSSGYLFIRVVPKGAAFLLTRSSLEFGTVIVGSASQHALTIQNTGAASLTITSFNINSSEFTIVSGGGAQVIPAGGSLNLNLQFSPANEGIRAGTLTINSNASNGAAIAVALSGVGQRTAPVLQLSAVALDFGSVTVGGTSVRSVTLSNPGNAALDITNQSIGGSHASDYSITHLSAGSIPPGGNDYIEIRFAPVSEGIRSAALSFSTNDVNNPAISVALNGQASLSSLPRISLSTTLLDFGVTTPGVPVVRDVIISNSGNADLLLASQSVSGSGFTLLTQAPSPIAPGSNGTIRVQFNPSNIGSWQGALDIACNDPQVPAATINLRGIGGSISGARIALSRSSIDFGNVPLLTSKEEEIIVRNIGSSDLSLSSQMITGVDALHFSIISLATSPIAAGGQTTARLRHFPYNAGSKIAFYRLQTNDPGAPTVDVALVSIVVGVEKLPGIPSSATLRQNYPNPFNPSTHIRYSVPHQSLVTIRVMNALGQQVDMLVNGSHDAGNYMVTFDATKYANGFYYYQMIAGKFVETKKMVLQK